MLCEYDDQDTAHWGCLSLGGLAGSALAGAANTHLGPRGVFMCMALSPLLVLLSALGLRDPRGAVQTAPASDGAAAGLQSISTTTMRGSKAVRSRVATAASGQTGSPTGSPHSAGTMRGHAQRLIQAGRHPAIWSPMLWIFLSRAVVPSISGPTFYFKTDVLHLSGNFLAAVDVVGYGALALGTALYNSHLRDLPFRKVFCWAQWGLACSIFLECLLMTRLNLRLGIPDAAFLIGHEVFSDVIMRLKMLPKMVLATRLCPAGIEGTFFAFLMSISNFAGFCSSFFGAGLVSILGVGKNELERLWVVQVISMVLALLPLMILDMVPNCQPSKIVLPMQNEQEHVERDATEVQTASQRNV